MLVLWAADWASSMGALPSIKDDTTCTIPERLCPGIASANGEFYTVSGWPRRIDKEVWQLTRNLSREDMNV